MYQKMRSRPRHFIYRPAQPQIQDLQNCADVPCSQVTVLPVNRQPLVKADSCTHCLVLSPLFFFVLPCVSAEIAVIV